MPLNIVSAILNIKHSVEKYDFVFVVVVVVSF